MRSPVLSLQPWRIGRRELRAAAFAFPVVVAFAAAMGVTAFEAPAHAAGLSTIDPSGGIYGSFHWETWQRGADLGVRAFGRFGRGDTIDTPPGDFVIQAMYHIWYDHLVELHGELGMGLSNGTFLYGGGLKLNLLELIDDAFGEFRERGLQRGLLSPVLKNLMLFASFDYEHISFKDADPALGLTYNEAPWRMPVGIGAQWYFPMGEGSFARRGYVETSMQYMKVSGSNYFMPYAGLGFEFR